VSYKKIVVCIHYDDQHCIFAEEILFQLLPKDASYYLYYFFDRKYVVLLVLRLAVDVIEVIRYITSMPRWRTRRNQII